MSSKTQNNQTVIVLLHVAVWSVSTLWFPLEGFILQPHLTVIRLNQEAFKVKKTKQKNNPSDP